MNVKKKGLSVILFGTVLALVLAMLVAVSVGCGENDPSGNDRLPPWAIAVICVGGVLIIGGVVAVIVIRKRKK